MQQLLLFWLPLQNHDYYSEYEGYSEYHWAAKTFNIPKAGSLLNSPNKWKYLGLDRLSERGKFSNIL